MTIHINGRLTAKDVATMTGGKLVGACESNILQITTDSRDIGESALFIAIRGDRFDGNDYVASATKDGAICSLCERIPDGFSGCAVLVEDTRLAMGRLANAYMARISPITVGVTGSVGKTTTKEFIYSVLSERYSTLKTFGNYNNEIGLPMTMLGVSPEHKAAVLEMGMSAKGEIEYLSRIARPDIAVITTIGTSHIGNLGSREAIRDAKMEIRKGLKENGFLILNGDEPLLAGIEGAMYVALENQKADCYVDNVIEGEHGTAFDLVLRGERFECITIPTIGIHNVLDAAFAWMVGTVAGIGEFQMRRGLMKFKNVSMRQSVYVSNGRIIIEDCYNASPESMTASISVLKNIAQKKKRRSVAVLGDMCELGEYSVEGHAEVGRAVAAGKIDVLVTFGAEAGHIASAAVASGMNSENVYTFTNGNDIGTLGKALARIVKSSDVILFKASRAVSMERAISFIK